MKATIYAHIEWDPEIEGWAALREECVLWSGDAAEANDRLAAILKNFPNLTRSCVRVAIQEEDTHE